MKTDRLNQQKGGGLSREMENIQINEVIVIEKDSLFSSGNVHALQSAAAPTVLPFVRNISIFLAHG